MTVVEARPRPGPAEVTLPGRLAIAPGINLPGARLSVKALTDKDLRDLDWTARHAGVDYVGLSFVRSADDVTRLREELASEELPARIVAKIEKPQAVAAPRRDHRRVRRRDGGAGRPGRRDGRAAGARPIQKQIIAPATGRRVPVITATQMLNSMESSSRPTRAEASDVFNAVLDGTDAVMLSGETAVGQFPVEAVATMSQIAPRPKPT